jgi:hypothetical protein
MIYRKTKKYCTVRTVSKSNRKFIEKQKNTALSEQFQNLIEKS